MVPNNTPETAPRDAFLNGVTWARLEHLLDQDSRAGDNARHHLCAFILGWAWHDDDLREAIIQDLAPELVEIPEDTITPPRDQG